MRRSTMMAFVGVGCLLVAVGVRADDRAEAFSSQEDGLHVAGMNLVVTVDASLAPVSLDNYDLELQSGAYRQVAVCGYVGGDAAVLVRVVTTDGEGAMDRLADLPVARLGDTEVHQRDRCVAHPDAVGVASDDDVSYLLGHGFSPQPAVYLVDSLLAGSDGRSLLVITYARHVPDCSGSTLNPDWRRTVENDLAATVILRPAKKSAASEND